MIQLKSLLKHLTEDFDYRGSHTAPSKHDNFSKPMHDLTDIYPDDIYSSRGAHLYGDRASSSRDNEAIRIIQAARNKPSMSVKVYRAIPKDRKSESINDGDWVTITKGYAVQHGESNLNGEYRIVSKTVQAKNLYTNGDSIHEWGYSQ